jgi:hypothetical protein
MPVDVIKLLQSIHKRGGYVQDADPKVGDLENVRMVTEWTGALTQLQIVTLKRNTMLITDSNKVVLGIDQDAKNIQYEFTRKTKRRTDEEILKMMGAMVEQLLGHGWTVSHNKGEFKDD